MGKIDWRLSSRFLLLVTLATFFVLEAQKPHDPASKPRNTDDADSSTDERLHPALGWNSLLDSEELKLTAGAKDGSNAPFAKKDTPIDDPQQVASVMKARATPTCSVRARVIDDTSSEPAPVVHVLMVSFHPDSNWESLSALLSICAGNWASEVNMRGDHEIVSDLGAFRASALEPGGWDVGIVSSDGRVGSAYFHVTENAPEASIEVRVGPMRSIVARVAFEDAVDASSLWVRAIPATEFPRLNVLALLLEPQSSSMDARVGADGLFRIDRVPPGPWKLELEGPGVHCERTVFVMTREDAHVTMYAKPRTQPALLQLTNLDSRFDGPLYVRLERDHEDPVEFIADPLRGRAQTFPVASGKSNLVVYPMHGEIPDVDKLPITRRTLDIPAGETCVVALYPR